METPDVAPSAWAVGIRRALLGTLAALVLLMVADKGSNNPVQIKSAHAASLSASPGMLFLADDFGTKGRILVADSSSQKICVYSITGDKMRLETVRDFSRDTDIVDAAPIPGATNGFEGANGLTSFQASQYADLVVKWKKEQDEKDAKSK